jgi:hypothetical protein
MLLYTPSEFKSQRDDIATSAKFAVLLVAVIVPPPVKAPLPALPFREVAKNEKI